MQYPKASHHQALNHLLRYVVHTVGQGISIKSSVDFTSLCDSDWAPCPDTRRSVTGYVMLLGNNPSWRSKKQSTISRSFSEADYRAMAAKASEITWLVRLLQEMGLFNLTPIQLKCDNQSASLLFILLRIQFIMRGPNTLNCWTATLQEIKCWKV